MLAEPQWLWVGFIHISVEWHHASYSSAISMSYQLYSFKNVLTCHFEYNIPFILCTRPFLQPPLAYSPHMQNILRRRMKTLRVVCFHNYCFVDNSMEWNLWKFIQLFLNIARYGKLSMVWWDWKEYYMHMSRERG